MTVYVTKGDYSAQKARLTRAINSGDPVTVLRAVESTLLDWQGKAWPDDWSRWERALADAFTAFVRSPAYDDDQDLNDGKIRRRFSVAFDRLHG